MRTGDSVFLACKNADTNVKTKVLSKNPVIPKLELEVSV